MSQPKLRRFQFGLGQLLLATTLFACGLGSIMVLVQANYGPSAPMFVRMLLWFVAPTCLFAAVFAMFGHARVGALIGLISQVVFTYCLCLWAGLR